MFETSSAQLLYPCISGIDIYVQGLLIPVNRKKLL